YWLRDAMLQYGIYPQPIGSAGLSRVDVRDIAEAAAIALTTEGLEGETLNLVGPEALTGPRTAEIWSKALCRPIAYAGDDLDAWERQQLQYLPAWMAFDLRMMYELFQREGFKGTREDVERQTKILGRAPRAFEDFARETAQAWTRSPSGVLA
ncbi:MAG TPA: FMN-dependent NADH-azoreductase, partial [Methylomirabilota bacterium]|nr:FMN-dependent NADH-azoreductase [Methylomirabilota bacterium]